MQRTLIFCFFAAMLSAPAWAQRMGGGGGRSGGMPQGGGVKSTPEEQDRQANAKKWQDVVDKARANSPPPPMPTITFPSKDEQFLRSLCCVEDPRASLSQYLDKLWASHGDAGARRVALDGLWKQAEKPRWARGAIEDFYGKRAPGQPLHGAPDAKDASAVAARSAAAPTANAAVPTAASAADSKAASSADSKAASAADAKAASAADSKAASAADSKAASATDVKAASAAPAGPPPEPAMVSAKPDKPAKQ